MASPNPPKPPMPDSTPSKPPPRRLFSNPLGNLMVTLLFLAAGILSLALGNREPMATLFYFGVAALFLVLAVMEWLRRRKR